MLRGHIDTDVLYLVLPDEAEGLQWFSPAETDLLLVAAAEDGVHRDGSRH